MRLLITGGSGFIGTNLVDLAVQRGAKVCNISLEAPKSRLHTPYWLPVDLMDAAGVQSAITKFAPTHLVHLAARTDLSGNNIESYKVNTLGTQTLIRALSSVPNFERAIVASSMLADIRSEPATGEILDTPYGQSKAAMEKWIKDEVGDDFSWSILRPTSVWGPWSEGRFDTYFKLIKSGLYFHPPQTDKKKPFIYVKNLCHIFFALLNADHKDVHRQIFNGSDWPTYATSEWAEAIRSALDGPKIRNLPMPIVRLAALAGDFAQIVLSREMPLNSRRLRNMQNIAPVDTTDLEAVVGPLPFNLECAVMDMLQWISCASERKP